MKRRLVGQRTFVFMTLGIALLLVAASSAAASNSKIPSNLGESSDFNDSSGSIFMVYPWEGTLGTEFSIWGIGFGEIRGEVLVGKDKCKVLEWSDTQVKCKIFKAQPAGSYPVTLKVKGPESSSQPMTFWSFLMEPPSVTLPVSHTDRLGLLQGGVLTLPGKFFGDKKGEVTVMNSQGNVEKLKVLEWGMNSIRFEVPATSVEPGVYELRIANDVGEVTGVANLSGMPGGDYSDLEIGKTHKNCSGIRYNTVTYVFFIIPDDGNIFNDPDNLIEMYEFVELDGYYWFSKFTGAQAPPEGYTDAQVVPVIIGGTLWAFVTGTNGHIYYSRYQASWPNYGTWDPDWYQIPGLATDHNWEVAPVYNPAKHRIELYYEYNRTLRWAYKNDSSTDWVEGGQVLDAISAPPSAYYHGPTGKMFVSIGDASGQLNILTVVDGLVTETVKGFQNGHVDHRPFIIGSDTVSSQVVWNNNGTLYSSYMVSDFSGTIWGWSLYPSVIPVGIHGGPNGLPSTWSGASYFHNVDVTFGVKSMLYTYTY